MMYSLEWEGEWLAVYCYGQVLAQVPPETATEVWSIAAGLAQRRQWSEFAALCAGIVYGTGKIGVPDVVGGVVGRARIAGGARRLPRASLDPAGAGSVIRFPGGDHDHD